MLLSELLGYVGTVLIVISLAMRGMVRLRMLNMIGAILFAIHGAMIGSFPVALLNTLTSFLNAFHLLRIFYRKENFELLAIDLQDPFLQRYCEFHQNDIRKIFPSFSLGSLQDYIAFYILRDMNVAGIFIAQRVANNHGSSDLKVILDHTSPTYHDSKNAKFLYKDKKNWTEKYNIARILVQTKDSTYKKILTQQGFREENGLMILKIS